MGFTVTHTSRDSDTSRPRAALKKRLKHKILRMAYYLGLNPSPRATKSELIELVTTDGPISVEE